MHFEEYLLVLKTFQFLLAKKVKRNCQTRQVQFIENAKRAKILFRIKISSRFLKELVTRKRGKTFDDKTDEIRLLNKASVHFIDKVNNLIETVENWMNKFFNIQFPFRVV